MSFSVYAGGVGCDCCGGEVPCAVSCAGCGPYTASDYCFCMTKIVFTQGSGDLASFEYTFSSGELCFIGTCADGFIAFAPQRIIVITASGRKILVSLNGAISCHSSGTYFQLVFDSVIEPQESGFVSPSFDLPGQGINNTGPPVVDPCDIDSMLGTYVMSYLNLFGDAIDLHFSLSSGGC